MKQKYTFLTTTSMMFLFAVSSFAQENFNREILPIVAPEPQTYTELDVQNTKPPAPFIVKAPIK